MPIQLNRIDHIVLTTNNLKEISDFYVDILGCEFITFGSGRKALKFSNQKINLHEKSAPIKPHALTPTPGALDLCFIVETPLKEIALFLDEKKISYEGPVQKTGAQGPIESIYLRDPDQNLIELSRYLK